VGCEVVAKVRIGEEACSALVVVNHGNLEQRAVRLDLGFGQVGDERHVVDHGFRWVGP
jgi:hypothetical protein